MRNKKILWQQVSKKSDMTSNIVLVVKQAKPLKPKTGTKCTFELNNLFYFLLCMFKKVLKLMQCMFILCYSQKLRTKNWTDTYQNLYVFLPENKIWQLPLVVIRNNASTQRERPKFSFMQCTYKLSVAATKLIV